MSGYSSTKQTEALAVNDVIWVKFQGIATWRVITEVVDAAAGKFYVRAVKETRATGITLQPRRREVLPLSHFGA